jgi:ATP-dependent RNA helicase HelY
MNDNNLDAPPAPREQWLQDATAALQERVGTPAAVGVLADAAKKSPSGELPPELFTALFKFELDTFQLQALRSLGRRRNVVVSAPTGSGKTVAGELAIYYALALGLRVFYTTPLKALSNQKFADFRTQYGPERVGLLTGDSGVNRDAPVVVMTTEVYRNMLYEGGEAEVKDVFAVVFDEFHYMNDPSRGTVWEESVISSPRSVQMIALSATMRNVEDIKGWFETTHGPTELVQSSFRPVPLRYYFATSTGIAPLFKDAGAGPGGLKDTEKDRGGSAGGTVSRRRSRGRWKGLDLNPDLLPPPLPKSSEELEHRRGRGRGRGGRDSPRDRYARGGRGGDRYGGRGREFGSGGGGGGRQNNRRSTEVASYPFLVRQLGRADMLPAIVFIFSRNGCDEAAMQVAQSRSVSLTPDEEAELERRLDDFQLRAPPGCGLSKESSEKDKSRLALLRRGVGVHHAGLLPLHKGLVEDLFNAGLIKVCFATETLAAGVNMPARTTVISVLSKRTDNGVGPLSVAQLLQMAGRAGRRGKDVQGNVVLMRSRFEVSWRTREKERKKEEEYSTMC